MTKVLPFYLQNHLNYDKTNSLIGKIQQFIIFKTFIRAFVQKQIDKETQMIVNII